MDKFKEIRPIVLGLLKRDGKILVSEGYDKVKDQHFYRSIGGGIEFLEKSADALKREFKEELGVDIKIGKYLGIAENIFTFNGKNGHELILFYEVEIDDKDYKEKYHIVDGSTETDAVWIDIEDFKSRKLRLYPEEVFEYL